MTDAARTLVIRFELGGEPLAGVIVGDGEEVRFVGWIQLASVIDRLRPRSPGEGGLAPAVNPGPVRGQAPPEALSGR